MIRIINVIPREDYFLEILFDNGNSVVLNFKSRLNTIRFGMLEDIEFFNKASTNGSCITWEEKVEVSLNEVFELARKH